MAFIDSTVVNKDIWKNIKQNKEQEQERITKVAENQRRKCRFLGNSIGEVKDTFSNLQSVCKFGW